MAKKAVLALGAVLLVLMGLLLGWLFWALPSEFHVVEGEEESELLQFPFSVEMDQAPVMAAENSSTPVQENITKTKLAQVTAFGIPVKEATVHIVPESQVLAGGHVVGIAMKTEGVLVLGTGEVSSSTGQSQSPAKHVLQTGDVILACNGQAISEKEELAQAVQQSNQGQVTLTVLRQGKTCQIPIQAIEDSRGEYRLGAWVRDSAQGLGTVTFIDPRTGAFGALGHGIYDVDTQSLLPLEEGVVTQSMLTGVEKSQTGQPGEIQGALVKNKPLGEVTQNTEAGIFGTIDRSKLSEVSAGSYPVAFRQDVTVGDAVILSDVLGGEVEAYDVRITQVNPNGLWGRQGMIVEVTDPELLEKTGGIVQGMSGSPIIQNGCLIGAVTHVFVQDSTKGYGIFLDEMMTFLGEA